MQSFSTIYFLVIALPIAGAIWFSEDMRSILRSGQRRNSLEIEGRWKDLELYFKRASRTYRPFVWLHQRFFLPGTVAAQYALFLFQRGRLDEALHQSDQALRQIRRKPRVFRSVYQPNTLKIHAGALRARILILTGMGRYDEARQNAADLKQLTGPAGRVGPPMALLELYCGHLDEALTEAGAVPQSDGQYDPARNIMALAYSMKGEFDRAAEVLAFEPGGIAKFYSANGLELVRGSAEGRRLIELQGKKLATVYPPVRLLSLAQIYIAKEDFEKAQLILDESENLLGPQPGLRFTYYRHQASCAAAMQNVARTEMCFAQMQAIVQELPKRALLWEMHYATGCSCVYLNRFGDSLAELSKAQQHALHPIEKHATAYWFGRAYERSGDRAKAAPYYQTVAADPISSWMRRKAIEALNC
jgi:tetratricopeptide (TPR) repeat protein